MYDQLVLCYNITTKKTYCSCIVSYVLIHNNNLIQFEYSLVYMRTSTQLNWAYRCASTVRLNNVHIFTFVCLSKNATDLNNFWQTESQVNYYTYFTLSWRVSLHYLVKHKLLQRIARFWLLKVWTVQRLRDQSSNLSLWLDNSFIFNYRSYVVCNYVEVKGHYASLANTLYI